LATRDSLEAVHDPAHVDRIERFCASGGGMIDLDTVASRGSWDAALHAAGGVVALVDALLGGEARAGASLHRPPGHHATRARAMGFCLFNAVAVGAQHALDAHALERVLILDWDVHHGNGTNDIFHASDRVLFASIHESPLYPGTGPAADTGSGAGEGFSVNLPVPGGSGDETWCSLVEHAVVPLARAYRPQLVLVSAGFDAHLDDPLAGCAVGDAGFAAMAGSVRRLADELGVPLGVVLEGGYELGALARSLTAVLEVVGAPQAPASPELAVHPLAAGAVERLAGGWPALRAP
jgi:acetoin utilization deacetylase AcuC-like enzyme